ncbi:hypothetical protein HMPREF0043_01555 [Actinobaculum sp. oral taxon 183 str. F0552]|nr:hypothetical protein HMPREF0043_01555 [Actinobaculum sp. oral taxon 183 str. F0552]
MLLAHFQRCVLGLPRWNANLAYDRRRPPPVRFPFHGGVSGMSPAS